MVRAKAGTVGRVAVLDAGGQYVDLVKKAIERHGVPADILPLGTPRSELEKTYAAIVISGSPASSHEETAPQPDSGIWKSPLPILGICYGMQAMAVAHGGTVARNAIREDGRVVTTVDTAHPLFEGSKKLFTALFTHGDFVTSVPVGFTAIGQHSLSDGSPAYSAVAKGNHVGVQFHPEVFDDTPEGYGLFRNFLHGIAKIKADMTFQEARLERIIAKKRRAIRKQAGGRHVIAFVSGGVDSSVAAALAAPVIDQTRYHAFYIDNGFMRDEDDLVIGALNDAGIKVEKVDAVTKFEQATAILGGIKAGPLKATSDPETKRKLIGKTFIDVQNDIIASLELPEALLLQGTNAADRIESGHSTGGHTEIIKTHHNQVKEVQELKALGMLIEPLDDLFKDEIRAIGHELGLPRDLVERQPFPGPGLAIRIIASNRDELDVQPAPVEAMVREFLKKCMNSVPALPAVPASRTVPASHSVAAHVLPVRSVGVGGDERSHLSVAALEGKNIQPEVLASLAQEIPAHFRGEISRVVYALGPQPLETYSVTKTLLTADVRAQLRQADRIVFEAMREFGVMEQIKQLPVILLPLSFGGSGFRSIVLRPVTTSTFMTVQAMLPGLHLPPEFFGSVTERILQAVPGISQVFLDLTNKPPGTTEWE